MAPDRILWFIPYDVHAAPHLVAAVLQHLAGSDLPRHRQFHRRADHGGLCQQPHDACAHRAGGEDDGVLRALFALRHIRRRFLATGFVGWLTAVSHSQRIGLARRDAVPLHWPGLDVLRQGTAHDGGLTWPRTDCRRKPIWPCLPRMSSPTRPDSRSLRMSARPRAACLRTVSVSGRGRSSKARAIPTSFSRSM